MAPKPKKRLAEVSERRPFHAHHLLIQSADHAWKISNEKGQIPKLSYMVVMLNCAIATESICNSVGSILSSNWDEWMKTLDKLELVCSLLQIDYKKDDEPWSTAGFLQAFRNDLVHAKPEIVEKKTTMTEEAFERDFDFPESKLEKQITKGNAERAITGIKKIRDTLCLPVPAGKSFGLFAKSVSASTRIYEV
ncbi:hypothetical protein QEH56_23925 [Pelagicoccus enzymogenes]|uniref:hypothetical protein n=1 Tax=Pelagicoccus enzymogenes TaxID=2773457 RepID=UPI00280F8361|nr:hypothetical protein [Pelagicoccus enzymogenes]MDQ8201234.1 hypothetical protein [Pelagicoccus enzymogenes]